MGVKLVWNLFQANISVERRTLKSRIGRSVSMGGRRSQKVISALPSIETVQVSSYHQSTRTSSNLSPNAPILRCDRVRTGDRLPLRLANHVPHLHRQSRGRVPIRLRQILRLSEVPYSGSIRCRANCPDAHCYCCCFCCCYPAMHVLQLCQKLEGGKK